jgi:HK97 family phage prohead protease
MARNKNQFGAAIEIKADALTEEGVFKGYGSTFGNIDQGRDIVVKGAFLESLNDRPANKVKLLWQHNPNEPIGGFTVMREDEKGLYVEGRLNMDVQRAREAYALMKAGDIDGLSIGYRVVGYEIDEDQRVRKLTKLDLRETSIVTFPMNEEATSTDVKSDRESINNIRDFETFLRDSGFTKSEAVTIASRGFKALDRSESEEEKQVIDLLTNFKLTE